jgi:cytochrome b
MERNTVKVWDPLVRIFHWSLVLSFTIAYVSGEEFTSLHIYSGYAVFGLILLRLVWGVIGTRHARFRDFVYRPAVIAAYLRDALLLRAQRYLGHNPAGGAMILLMLVVLVLTAISGMAVTGIGTGTGPLAVLAGSSQLLEEALEELHEFLAVLMVLLVVVHVGGVIAASIIHRESLVKAMLTGRKHA